MRLGCIVSVGFVEESILGEAQMLMERTFGFEVQRMHAKPPPAAFDPSRGQWSAVEFMKELVRICPPGASRILGLTSDDLFVPVLSFLFGQAQLGGAAALVSTARLRQEFYGLPSNQDLLLMRVRKEILHEMGHTLGLVHCPDRSCAMCLSTNLEQVDIKGDSFCRPCSLSVDSRVKSLMEEGG